MPWKPFNPIWLSLRQPAPAALRKKPFWLYNMVISRGRSSRTGAQGREQAPGAAWEGALTLSLTLQPVDHVPHGGDEVLVLLGVGQDDAVQSVHVGIDRFHRGGFPAAYGEHRGMSHKVHNISNCFDDHSNSKKLNTMPTHKLLLWQILLNNVLLTLQSE